jgi:hypothetical protein
MTTKIATREDAEKVCIYWSCDDPEIVTCKSAEEAIEEVLEYGDGDRAGTITLKGYVEMPLSYNPVHGPLSRMLESLDEEFSDPCGNGTIVTDSMLEAEKVFIAAVLAEYKNRWLHDVYTEKIDVAAWILANRPEWLNEEEEAP